MLKYLVASVLVAALVACGGTAEPRGSAGDAGERHAISLFHCGIEPTNFDGDRWYVENPPFDETNKGPSLEGKMTRLSPDKAVFETDSGETVEFTQLVGEWDRPLCD